MQAIGGVLIGVGAVLTAVNGHVLGGIFLGVCAVGLIAVGGLLAPRRPSAVKRQVEPANTANGSDPHGLPPAH